MECREFDELIQEMLDCRQFRTLPDDAAAHIRSCTHCRSNFSFYQQLSALTASPSTQHQIVDQMTSTNERATTMGRGEPILAPVLRLRDGRQPFGMWRKHWLSVAALLCLSLVAWQYWPAGSAVDPNSVPLAVVPDSGPAPSPTVSDDPASPLNFELASSETADSEPMAPTYPTPDDFQRLTEGLDESVVALDRRWQQMATGRVRAHQIPGLQPAVYPFTGAVEAFRKTMIVRNQNGVAAGVRW